MVGAAARLTSFALFAGAFFAATAVAQELQAIGNCRDGAPHGAYELRSSDGRLRVAGAFNRGKRTSSFIFWTTAGVRVAHIPYDEDVRSGTVSLWYADAAPGREPQQKLEAAYTAGVLDGMKRSWHPNGRKRAVFRYDKGLLVEASAWSASGAALTPDAARRMAANDLETDERYYASLDAIVRAHPPPCDRAPAGHASAGPADYLWR